MPTPTLGIIQQIIDQVSSPAWLFSVLFVGLIVGIIAALIATRLDRYLARFSSTRRERLTRWDHHREQLTATLVNQPQLQQLIAHRITDLRINQAVAFGVMTILFASTIMLVDRWPPDAGPLRSLTEAVFPLLVVLILVIAVFRTMVRVRRIGTDLNQALSDAVAHDDATTALRSLDAERRAGNDLPYYFGNDPEGR